MIIQNVSPAINRNNFQNQATHLLNRVQTVAKLIFKHLGDAFKYAFLINLACIRWQFIVAGASLPTFAIWHIATLAILTLGISAIYAYKNVPVIQDVPVIQGALVVNQQKLNKQPEPVSIAQLLNMANQVEPPIQIKEVIARFKEVFQDTTDYKVLHTDLMGAQIRDITKERAKERIRSGYIGFIQEYQNDQGYNRNVADTMGALLKGVIFELRNPELAIEKKKEALISLSKASDHCPPRRYEEILKVYKTLSSQIETADQILLEVTRQVKEDLFTNYYSLSREPVMTLNYIRKIVGAQLGLDINPLNLADIHIDLNDARSPQNKHVKHTSAEQFIGVFNKIYTPERVIALTTDYLNSKDREIQTQLVQYISNEVQNEIEAHLQAGKFTQARAEALSDSIETTFMDLNHNPDKLMTPMGVKYLLLHFGILNDSKPAHIGRFEAPVVA